MNQYQKEAALSRIRIFSLALIVLGVSGLLLSLLPGSLLLTDDFGDVREEGFSYQSTAESVGYFLGLGIFFGAMIVPGWIASGLAILAGFKLRNLQWRSYGIFVCIMSMIPCFWNCVLPGIAVGIWGLVVLLDSESTALFESERPGANRTGQSSSEEYQLSDHTKGLPGNPYESPQSDKN